MDPPRIERGSPECKSGILAIGQWAHGILKSPQRFLTFSKRLYVEAMLLQSKK